MIITLNNLNHEEQLLCRNGNYYKVSQIMADKNDHSNQWNGIDFFFMSNDNMFRVVCDSYPYFSPYGPLPTAVQQAQIQAFQPSASTLPATRSAPITNSTAQLTTPTKSKLQGQLTPEGAQAELMRRAQIRQAAQTELARRAARTEIQHQPVLVDKFNNYLSALLPVNYTISSFWDRLFFAVGYFLIFAFIFSVMMKLIRYTTRYIVSGQKFGFKTFLKNIF